MKGLFGIVGTMDKWKKGDFPNNQMVSITLENYLAKTDEKILLSCELASDGEVDYAIDNLIKNLEFIRKKAKKNIRDTNIKIRSNLK